MAADRFQSAPTLQRVCPSFLWMVFFAVLIGASALKPALATDYKPPSLTAWQRSHEAHLTIEWESTARVQQKRTGDQLILRFNRPVAADISWTLKNLSNFVDPDRTVVEGRDLTLALRPGVLSKVRVREKRIVTVDFSRNPSAPQSARLERSTIENGIRLTVDWPGPTDVKTDLNAGELRLQVYPARDFDTAQLADLQSSLMPWFSSLRTQPTPSGSTLTLLLEPYILSSVRSESSARTVIDLVRDASTTPKPAAGAVQQLAIPKKDLTHRPQKKPVLENIQASSSIILASPGESGPPIPARRPMTDRDQAHLAFLEGEPDDTPSEDKARPDALIIDWGKPVPAAIFIRAGHLWAVFDTPDIGDLKERPALPSAFGPAMVVPTEGATALRFPLKEPVNITVNQPTEGRWRIEPTTVPAKPRSAVVERTVGSSALLITPASSPHVVRLKDPSVGDRIDVLPLLEPGLGMSSTRRFVDLELLPTAQGVAWRPLNDQLIASVEDGSLTLSSPNGLALSTPAGEEPNTSEPAVVQALAEPSPDERGTPDVVKRPATMPAKTDPPPASVPDPAKPSSYFNLAGSGVERELVGEYRRIRRQAIAKAKPEERDQARLELARLLVSERLATEARTVLKAISDDAESDVILQRRALSGVSAFLIGRLAEASALLLDPSLSDDEEIGIWRAALNSVESDWQRASEAWRDNNYLLDIYPPRLRIDLGLMALEAAIETNDRGLIQDGITRLSSMPLNPYDAGRVDAMKALKAERGGDLEKARALLANLTKSPHPAIRTLADFQLASLDLNAGDQPADVLATLDKRMPLWRGHPKERAMLNELARRFRDVNALRKALTIWRRLIRLYPEAANEESLMVARQDTFMQALANETEPKINLLDVYAIYLDFIDLLPDDPRARDVHRNLARHLSALDLLDEAIDVLQTLLASTDDDSERAELASEIATLMLRQERAGPALSILDGTEGRGALSPALDEKRRSTRAEALAKLDRPDDALRALRDLQSQSVQQIRAAILWKERRWPRLAAALESYFADTVPASSLSEDDQERVLWLALARQETGGAKQLRALRERFDSAMQAGPYAQAFDLATRHHGGSGDIETLLAATAGHVTDVQRFLETTPTSP